MSTPASPDERSLHRLGYASPTAGASAVRVIVGGERTPVTETLAEEIPVTFAYNGVPYAVMMATPADLEDFAVGFSLSEGLVANAAQLLRIDVVRHSRGVELQLEVPATTAAALSRQSRRLPGRTGCGICGMTDVDQLLRDTDTITSALRVEPAAVQRAMGELVARQPLNEATGAMHAAAWARPDGALLHLREDVGRHNALDKLLGALVRCGAAADNGFVVMTSRGSFELVQKAASFGVPLLATVSAPTALAARVAQAAGVTLAGFARADRMTLYTHPERVAPV